MIAIGLMSGTSLDGIDAALVRIEPRGNGYAVELLDFVTHAFSDEDLTAIRAALPPNAGSTKAVADLNVRLGRAFAAAALAVRGDTAIDFIASHGQTVWHDGDAHVTLQICDPFVLREAIRSTVCFDFRSADCAAGGHGAPLVPYVDALLLGAENETRVALNIGGIANLTVVPPNASPEDVTAFDTGPGNMLIDAFVSERTHGAHRYDESGARAARGRVDPAALQALLRDAYFALPAPKTTGRERFGSQFLLEHARLLEPLTLEDGCATLAALTAQSVADAIRLAAPQATRVLVSGGGARNATLVRMLQERLSPVPVEPSSAMNLDPDAKEAIAFAVLGYETLRERAANVPRVTGASRATALGAIAPYELHALLQKVERECRA